MTFKKILIGWASFFLIIGTLLAMALWSATRTTGKSSAKITISEDFIVVRATGMKPGYLMRGVAAEAEGDYLGKVTVTSAADKSIELRPGQIAPNLWVENTTLKFGDPSMDRRVTIEWWNTLQRIIQNQTPLKMRIITDAEETSEGVGAILFTHDEFLCGSDKSAYRELLDGWRHSITISCTLASTGVMRE